MKIHISPDVIRLIVRKTAMEVEGVTRVIAKAPWSFGLKSAIGLKMEGEKIDLTLHLALRYGVDIMAVCREVQRVVKRAVENLVGIEVSSVDIIVEDIDMVQDEKAKS
ncbi:MAG: Asp23/Gls24 family envelope stress response protein [Caldiserica bacterium]|jgi:uncharacterized alkaline shock family protein YloU|nr:Asp23/Gls24 family envelope stress response protein [Caldisericota bacterium]MDH7562937.1 Asp23/Gls24 family envelope stress response protein [Caldisericota bacterium]